MDPLQRLLEAARRAPARIVLPEADDPRVLCAAERSVREGTARPVLLGAPGAIRDRARVEGIDLAGIALADPADSASFPGYAEALHALRAHRGMTLEQARLELLEPLCRANMMVHMGEADGLVAGAVHTTADVVRNAIRIIGMEPSCRLVSSFFLMVFREPSCRSGQAFLFTDCGLVVEPDEEELAQIAIAAAGNARRLLGEEPRLAMLSFSTNGSAHHARVSRVVDAARLVRKRHPELAIDEDVQLDAAIVADIARRKLPGSRVQGRANVLVFPSLEAGNIGYKLAERFSGALAIGPLLQGLAKPASDLSRGCSEDDVFHVMAVTGLSSREPETPEPEPLEAEPD
jgi:phosphate acetyltransferase